MKNANVYNYLSGLSETRIWKLIWIAGNPDREDVEEIIDSMLDDGSSRVISLTSPSTQPNTAPSLVIWKNCL